MRLMKETPSSRISVPLNHPVSQHGIANRAKQEEQL